MKISPQDICSFLPLLDAVMTMRPEGLKVVPVPEQHGVASMGVDVVDMPGGRTTDQESADGVQVQELGPYASQERV